MTDNDIAGLGEFCERLMATDTFNIVVAEYEKSTCHQILATKPGDEKAREQIYSAFYGLQTFLGFMHELVMEKQKLETPAPKEDDQDIFEDFDN